MMYTFSMRFRSLGILLVLCLLLWGCGKKSSDLTLSSSDGSKTVTILIEVADEPEERARGLMNRTELPQDTGMLFVFPESAMRSFWMKNTLIPLEIFYFDGNGEFVSWTTMQPCEKEPCPTYDSASLAKYALEVSPGFRAKNGIGVGWNIDIKTHSS